MSPRLLYTDSRELPAVKEATQHSVRGKVLKSEDMHPPHDFSLQWPLMISQAAYSRFVLGVQLQDYQTKMKGICEG